jgi:hypothetical protein
MGYALGCSKAARGDFRFQIYHKLELSPPWAIAPFQFRTGIN